MGLERPEFVAPEALYFSKPRLKFGEWLSPQAVEPYARVVVDRAFLDELRPPQNPQMAAHGRSAHVRSKG
jgi:hypothetical protein